MMDFTSKVPWWRLDIHLNNAKDRKIRRLEFRIKELESAIKPFREFEESVALMEKSTGQQPMPDAFELTSLVDLVHNKSAVLLRSHTRRVKAILEEKLE